MILGCINTERRHKGTQMKVVIVDNEPTILRSLEILIQSKVDGVSCFTNPHSALKFLEDYAQTVKVIISGHIDLISNILDRNIPVDHLLSKPFDLDHVFSILTLPNKVHIHEQQ